MTVSEVPACTGVHAVDTELLGLPGLMSAYLVAGDDGVAVVDPGAAPAAERILDGLAARGYDSEDVTHLLPTHVHLDHAGATGALAEACPDATVVVHERGRRYLTERAALDRLVESAREAMGDVADGYGDPDLVPAERCRSVGGGERVEVGGRTLRVVDAPGHAPHQYCLRDDGDGALFAADAAGMWIADELYPTTPPPDFDLEASVETVDRLLDTDPEVLCYGHFGARTDAATALREYRDLLPAWVDAVRTATAPDRDRSETLAALGGRWQGPTVERDLAGAIAYLRETESREDSGRT